MVNTNEIMVSIICDCYNHEKYIRACLDGFVMQECNFSFEVLIHDDASTDNSVAIIKEYEEKYPDIIKPIYQKENKYSSEENVWLDYQFPRATGKYIAICEGDDYWIDPLKLQKQVDFLESHEDYVLCYHKVQELYPDGNIIEDSFNKEDTEKDVTLQYLAEQSNIIHTPSIVFRKKTPILPLELANLPAGDYPLNMYLLQYGKGRYFPQEMAIYRRHEASVWSLKSTEYIYKRWSTVVQGLLKYFKNNEETSLLLQKQLIKVYKILFDIYIQDNKSEYLTLLQRDLFKSNLGIAAETYLEILNIHQNYHSNLASNLLHQFDGRTLMQLIGAKIKSRITR